MNWNHGGDVSGYRLAFGKEPLDFSASLNPFGMPEGVREAARRAVDAAVPYPDPFCRALAAALAERLDVIPERIFFGNGAAEVIFRLVQARRPRVALVSAPSFAEYDQALVSCGCRVDFHPLTRENGFLLDDSILERIISGVDMLFLCQPNNPTGLLIDAPLLQRIVQRCFTAGTLLVMDECFLPFVDDAAALSLLPAVARSEPVVVLGSFTKMYAMAGLRLGYALCGDDTLVRDMYRIGPPWSVSTVAQAAGLAALTESGYERRSLPLIREERAFLRRELAALGLDVFDSAANYLFFSSPRDDLAKALLPQGVMLRDCGNFRGLKPGYYRAAVRLHEENVRLLEALGRVL